MKLTAEMFHHPLTEVSTAEINGVDTEVVNLWGAASYWCWEACTGNEKAVEVIKECIFIARPEANTDWLLKKAKSGNRATILQLINAIKEGLDKKSDFAFSK